MALKDILNKALTDWLELLNNPISYSPDVCFHYSDKSAGKSFICTCPPSLRNSLSNFAKGCYLSYLAHASVVTVGNNRHKNAINPQLVPVWCHRYSNWDNQEQKASGRTNTWTEDSKWIKCSLIFNFWRRKLSSALKMTVKENNYVSESCQCVKVRRLRRRNRNGLIHFICNLSQTNRQLELF